VIVGPNGKQTEKLIERLKSVIINPGFLYRYRKALIFNVRARSLRDIIHDEPPSRDEKPIDLPTLFPAEKQYRLKAGFDSLQPRWKRLAKSVLSNISGKER
jgi:hypothetical protein